jgi:hypothetical protein
MTFSYSFDNEKIEKKTAVAISDLYYRTLYSSDGGVQWLLVKPWTSSIGQCTRYCTGALPQPSTWPPFLGVFVDCFLFACCPGSCWGDTEQVVAQWRHPVASGVALDMLHWVMHFVLHRRTAMAIKTANVGGTC